MRYQSTSIFKGIQEHSTDIHVDATDLPAFFRGYIDFFCLTWLRYPGTQRWHKRRCYWSTCVFLRVHIFFVWLDYATDLLSFSSKSLNTAVTLLIYQSFSEGIYIFLIHVLLTFDFIPHLNLLNLPMFFQGYIDFFFGVRYTKYAPPPPNIGHPCGPCLTTCMTGRQSWDYR